MREHVKLDIAKMLSVRVIAPATSKWASPLLFAPRKNGTLRFCADYSKLNLKTLADAYSLSRMDH